MNNLSSINLMVSTLYISQNLRERGYYNDFKKTIDDEIFEILGPLGPDHLYVFCLLLLAQYRLNFIITYTPQDICPLFLLSKLKIPIIVIRYLQVAT